MAIHGNIFPVYQDLIQQTHSSQQSGRTCTFLTTLDGSQQPPAVLEIAAPYWGKGRGPRTRSRGGQPQVHEQQARDLEGMACAIFSISRPVAAHTAGTASSRIAAPTAGRQASTPASRVLLHQSLNMDGRHGWIRLNLCIGVTELSGLLNILVHC